MEKVRIDTDEAGQGARKWDGLQAELRCVFLTRGQRGATGGCCGGGAWLRLGNEMSTLVVGTNGVPARVW